MSNSRSVRMSSPSAPGAHAACKPHPTVVEIKDLSIQPLEQDLLPLECPWPQPPTLGPLTWSVKGENVAFAFGGALGRVGLRAAARAPPALSLRGNLLVRGRVQIWEQMEEEPSKEVTKASKRSHPEAPSQQSTCRVLPLAPIAPQDGARGSGQALQGGRRQNLFGAKLGQLGKALLEIHLRQDPARPTGTHQQGIYTLVSPPLLCRRPGFLLTCPQSQRSSSAEGGGP